MRKQLNVMRSSIVITSLLIGGAEFFAGSKFVFFFIALYSAFFISRLVLVIKRSDYSKVFWGLIAIEFLITSVSYFSILNKKDSEIGEMFEVASNYKTYYRAISRLPIVVEVSENVLSSEFIYTGDIFSCDLFCVSGKTPKELKVILSPGQISKCERSAVCNEIEKNSKINIGMTYDTEEISSFLNFPEVSNIAYSPSKDTKIINYAQYNVTQLGPNLPKFLTVDVIDLQVCIDIVRNFVSSPLYRIPSKDGPTFEENIKMELRFQGGNGKEIGGCSFIYNDSTTKITSIL